MTARLAHATALAPGAIAILQIVGDIAPILRSLTGLEHWPIGRARLVDLGGIDEGLAVRLRDDLAQLMPHGGPRVVQRLTALLRQLGATIESDLNSIDPRELFPEAADRFEALALGRLARANSPLAIDLLLDQPRRWRAAAQSGVNLTAEDRARSARLDRLLLAPVVVLAGLPNVGKSTLSNALLGRAMSIDLDMPGTTRDYTVGQIDLGGLVVQWHDTPGIRETADPIEQKSIEVASRLIDQADLLIAMTDPQSAWPRLPRTADVLVMNKIDLHDTSLISPTVPAGALPISAATGQGLPALVTAIRDRLVHPQDLNHPERWIFDPRLEAQTS